MLIIIIMLAQINNFHYQDNLTLLFTELKTNIKPDFRIKKSDFSQLFKYL